MHKWTLLLILGLSFLIDVEGAISTGKIVLDNAVPSSWIPGIKAWDGILLYCGNSMMGILAALGLVRNNALAKVAAVIAFIVMLPFLVVMSMTGAHAQAMPVKAPVNPFAQPYDPGKCGGFFGINTIGLAGAVNGTAVQPGTQVVQGGIGGEVGYGCPINAATGSFWFAEAMADITNLNGNVNGISLRGPVSFTERFGFGTPLTNMLPSFFGTSASSPSAPNLPALPNGVTAGPGNPYAFLALHQYDVSAYDGLNQNRQWLLTYGVGLGILYRLSNQVVADTFAEWQFASNSFCYGPLGASGCDKFGQRAMVGVELKY